MAGGTGAVAEMIRLSRLFQDDPLMAASTGSSNTFLLWIDAVGGYWVTMSDDVVIGQPTADVDSAHPWRHLSKRHARICRDGEGYLIEALRGFDQRPAGTTAGPF